ncbi:sulfotransferase family 2 domain-containing protein [Albidovulum sp.]
MTGRFDHFVIFAEMRTGSNLLEATLEQVPGVHCHGEIFNPVHLGGPKKKQVLGMTMAERLADPAALLARVRQAEGLNGFRFFHDHEPRVLDEILGDPRCAKIVLTRNPVDCYVSLKIARNTQKWRLTDVKDRVVWRPTFRAEEFESFLEERQQFQLRLLNALQVTGQTAFYLDYEDSLRVDVINGLLRFLGLAERLEAIAGSLVRQNPEELEDKVRNFAEMEEALQRIDWASLARTPNFEPRRGPGVPRMVAAAGAPLLYVPIPPFADQHLRAWLAALGEGGLIEGFTQKSLRQWKRKAPGHRSFTLLRHPLDRAWSAYARVLTADAYRDMRATLRGHHALPLPEDEAIAAMDAAAHRAAFLGFLDFVKVNLAGQTGMRQDLAWGTQWSAVNGMANFTLPDVICRAESLAEDLAYLARAVGVAGAPAPGPETVEPLPVPLAAIADEEVESRVRDVYRKDFMAFGFGAWKAPKPGSRRLA